MPPEPSPGSRPPSTSRWLATSQTGIYVCGSACMGVGNHADRHTCLCFVLLRAEHVLAHQCIIQHGCLMHRWIGYATLVITIIGLLSTGIAQVIACRYLLSHSMFHACLAY